MTDEKASQERAKQAPSEQTSSEQASFGTKPAQDRPDGQAALGQRSTSEAAAERAEAADLAAGAEKATGRRWLKYAGIGSGRTQQSPHAKPAPSEVTSLGSLEAEVMGVLWEIGTPATGMEVMETTLYRRRAQGLEPPSFASIATTLRRLTEKGLLETRKNEARTPTYWPKVEREQMAARILNNVSQTLLGSSLHSLLPKLIGRASFQAISSAEEENIQRLMEALEELAETDGSMTSRPDEHTS